MRKLNDEEMKTLGGHMPFGCTGLCLRGRNACLQAGIPEAQCDLQFEECLVDCMGTK